tara:strand:- start:7755 stop:7955 length:201 start_codon:yes stop_codon:yes gene_type:complete
MSNKKRIYEIFNTTTGKWEESSMSEANYQALLDRMDSSADELEAEFKIISKIIELKQGYNSNESMD